MSSITLEEPGKFALLHVRCFPPDSFFKNGKNRADTKSERYFNQAKISDQTS